MPPSGLLLQEAFSASSLEKTRSATAKGEQTCSASPGWVASHPFASPRVCVQQDQRWVPSRRVKRSESKQETVHWDLGMVHRGHNWMSKAGIAQEKGRNRNELLVDAA